MIFLNFTKDQSKISIVAPCFNEESNIFELCDRTIKSMDRANLNFELILVDDGSTDSTWEKIQNMAKTFTNVIAIKNKTNLGIFYSWHRALKESTGDFVCLIDSDLQNTPEDIPRLYEKFHVSNTTIVQGHRSSIEWDKDGRYFSSRGLNFILNKVFKDNAKDNKSGFLLAPKSIVEEILKFHKKYHYPHTFIRVSARSKGYSVTEIETLFLPRRSGSSFLEGMNFVIIYIRVMGDILRALREFGRGQNSLPNTGLDKYSVHSRSEYGYSGLRRLIFDFYFFTLPLHSWLITKNTKRIYGILKKTQWLPPEEIRELQDQRLRRLIWHAYSNVPYYQKLFLKHGINPSDIDTSKDLVKIPLLNKSDVSENLYMELFSIRHKKKDMHKIATSGSTGQPFVTYADKEQLEFRFATTLRCSEWTGWRFGDRQIRLWHQKLGMSKKQVIKEKFDAFLLRRKFIPAFELTEESLKQLVVQLNKYKPKLIDGYAESLNFLALYLTQGGRLDFKPKGLMSSAQMLTTQTRLQIEEALGAKVLDKYGAREFSGIAYQCQSSKDHHIMDESYIVEILKDGRPAEPGELGEVVITDLNNFSVPLIRYRIGDLAVQVDNSLHCKCGRGLSQIGEIHGRTQALVFCSNERWLPGTFFAHFFKDYENLVRFYQIIQEVKGQFELKIVKGPVWNEDSWNALITHLREFIGDTKIQVVYQDVIPLLKTGKRSPVISKIIVDFQNLP